MGNSGSAQDEARNEYGGKIYDMAEGLYPNKGDKITGMILEADRVELQELLDNNQLLTERIHAAATELDSTGDTESVVIPDLQTLGDRMFGTVQQLYPALAENVTGMLLEMGQQELYQLLNDRGTLIHNIHAAAHVLMNQRLQETHPSSKAKQENEESLESTEKRKISSSSLHSVGEERAIIGEEIYAKIADVHSRHADRITGMLLEMNSEDLKDIMRNQAVFETKVKEALDAIEEVEKDNSVSEQMNENTITVKENTGSDDEKTIIGEEIFSKIFHSYPQHADKITGMLLEMNLEDLKEVNKTPALLETKVKAALNAIRCLQNRDSSEVDISERTNEKYITVEVKSGKSPVFTSSEIVKKLSGSSAEKHKELLGEMVYDNISKVFPSHADKVTGMLMEMELKSLLELLQDRELYEQRVSEAAQVLGFPNQAALKKPPVLRKLDDAQKSLLMNPDQRTKEELIKELRNKLSVLYPQEDHLLIQILPSLDSTHLIKLLGCQEELKENMDKLINESHQQQVVDASDTDLVNGDSRGHTKEEIYNLLLRKISRRYPTEAEMLSAILKEEELEVLKGCHESDEMLQTYAERARKATRGETHVSAFGTEFF